MRSLEEEFWADPANVPQYDPDTLHTVFPADGPEDEPVDTRPPLFDPAAVPSSHKPPPVPDELPKASAPIAAADPRVVDDGGGYDWQRALTSLFGGNEGVSALDRRRAAAQQERADRSRAARELSKDRRDEEKWQLERDVLAPAKVQKLSADADKARTAAQAKALAISSSPESQAMRETIASGLSMQAQRLKASGADDFLVRQLEGAAQNMRGNPSMSGVAALDAAKMFGKLGESVVFEALAKNKQLSLEGYRDQALGQQGAGLGERQRHNMVMEGIAAQSADRKASQDVNIREQAQEKLNAEINNSQQALDNMEEIGRLKDKVNTGFITGAISKWIGKPFDLNSANRNQLEALVARTFNRETKELAGSAVSAAEWARIEPQIPQVTDDDGVFRQKLAMAMQTANEILAKRKQQYQLNKNKTPTDTSITAQKAAADGVAASAKDEKTAKADRARAAIADPSASEKAKAGARAWLKDNGYGE